MIARQNATAELAALPRLAEDVLVPREAHRVGHDEEEAGEAEPLDEREFVLEQSILLVRERAPSLAPSSDQAGL